MKALSLNLHRDIFRFINNLYKNILGNKNDLESERSFKVIFVESKKYIQDNKIHYCLSLLLDKFDT